MIEHELLLLGLLKESPRHGYEIKKEIKDIFSLFVGVNPKSIYYPLRMLEKKGLVAKRLNRRGRRPERIVYTLTPKGETRFTELLTKSFLNFKRPEFTLDLSLYFLRYLNPGTARRRLRARLAILKKISRSLAQLIVTFKSKKSSPILHILEHNLNMLESESEFLANLIVTVGRKENY